jgi:hypothetical protein
MIALAASEPRQEALSAEWHRITGDSFIVDVRPITGDPSGGSWRSSARREVLRPLPEDNWHAAQRLKGKRLLNSFGLFRGVEVPESPLTNLWTRPLLGSVSIAISAVSTAFTGESPKAVTENAVTENPETRYTVMPADPRSAADLPGWRPEPPTDKATSRLPSCARRRAATKAAIREGPETRPKVQPGAAPPAAVPTGERRQGGAHAFHNEQIGAP